MQKRVVIVGGGFGGLNAAKTLGRCRDVQVTLIDRRNHHLFQPLLYQVATAGLSPADIAAPIRTILSPYKNTQVLQGEVTQVVLESESNYVVTDFGREPFDYLILACGATHSYFGHDEWRRYAPGLKTIENATEIRRRILYAYELAERTKDPEVVKGQLTFVVVGGGPTGVELAGAIGEMSRFTLDRDFRSINAKATRIFLMEGGDRILPAYPKDLSDRAARDLEQLGVQVWTSSMVTQVDDFGVTVGNERIHASTVIWAAGVQASKLNQKLPFESDRQGRVIVQKDLSPDGFPHVFILGDQAHCPDENGEPLPGLAPVAIQQGRFVAKNIMRELDGKPREDFKYSDKGIMATIGRNKAVAKTGKWKLTGRFAWLTWMLVHIYFLTGFRNRLFVFLQWAWSYVTYRRGARLIVGEQKEKSKADGTD